MLVITLILRSLDINFDVNQAIKQLTDVLGKYGPVVWEALIRQVYFNGVVDLIWMALFIAVGIVCYRLSVKLFRYGKAQPPTIEGVARGYNRHNDDRDWFMGLGIAGLIASIVIPGIIAMVFLSSALQDFINPVWAAVQLLKDTSGH